MSIPTPLIQYSLSDATMKDLLPSGYLPLEYIESTGTQYINTGFKPTNNTSIETKILYKSVTNSSYISFMGTRSNGKTSTQYSISLDPNNLWYSGSGNSQTSINFTTATNTIYIYIYIILLNYI